MTTNYTNNFNGTCSFSDTCRQISLAANIEQHFTVPGTKDQNYQALFGYNLSSNVYVGINVTAVSPTAGTTNSTGNIEFKPDKRYVQGGDVLSFVSPDSGGAYMGVSLRILPS